MSNKLTTAHDLHDQLSRLAKQSAEESAQMAEWECHNAVAEPIYQLFDMGWYDTDKQTYDSVTGAGCAGRIVYAAPQPLNDAERTELQERRKAAATPVAWTDEVELRDVEANGFAYLFTVKPITPHADPRRVIKLYAEPPRLVVPEDCPSAIRDLIASHSDALFNDGDAQEIWNACRATMYGAKENASI